MLGQQKDAQITVTGNVQDAVNKLNQVHKQIGKFEKSMVGVKTSTDKAGKGLYTASGQFEKFTKATKKASDAVSTRPKGFANQMAGLAFIIRTTFLFSLASIGITAINKFKASIGEGIKQLIAFELQLAEINTLLNINDLQYQQLRQTLRDVNKQYKQSMEIMTRGAYDLISAGVALENLESALVLNAKAATAGLTEINVAARASIATINSYKLAHEDLEHVLDLEFQTVKMGVLIYQDVADNIGVILPAAVKLGVSLEDMHASFATLTKAGLGPAMAATALSRAFDQLVQRSEALEKVGIPVYDKMTGKFRGMAAIIDDIRVKIGRMTDEQRAWFFEQINFEIRAGRAMSGLVSQYDTLLDSINAMENATGSLIEAFDKMADTADTKLALAKDRIKDIAYEVEDKLLPALADVVGLFAEIGGIAIETASKITEAYKPTSEQRIEQWVKTQILPTASEEKTQISKLAWTILDIFTPLRLVHKLMHDDLLDTIKDYELEFTKLPYNEILLTYWDLEESIKKIDKLKKAGFVTDKQENAVLAKRKQEMMKLLALEKVAFDRKIELIEFDKAVKRDLRPAEDPAVVEREIKIAKLQEEFDKKHKKNLIDIRLELMATGMVVKEVFDLSKDELLIAEKRLKIQEDQEKLFDKYLKTKQKLIAIGITEGIALGADLTETTLSFLTSRYNKAASLIHKWQIILIDQGYKLQEVLKITYADAIRLEELEEQRKEQLREMERDIQHRMREAEQVINYVFVDPIQDAFDSIILKTEELDKAFSDMITSILQSLARLMFSKLLQSFVNFLIPTDFVSRLFGYAAGGISGEGSSSLGGGGFGKPGLPDIPSIPNHATPIIIQNINVDRLLPHTEETLRRFSIDQQKLAIKEAIKEL